MKLLRNLLILTLLLIGVRASAQTSAQQQKVIDAMLSVYDDELRTDSQNYGVWFRRASLFYGLNQYSRALSDIDNAIKYTPDSDTDLLSQEYALRANIYRMLDRPEKALEDIAKAYEVDPSSYALLYQKANLEYELGDMQNAKEDYRRLGRIHNRSLESLVGLSRVAVKESNLGLANDYIDQAVANYPAEPEAYLRRASVRQLLGNNTGAVDDMIMALSLDKDSRRAISAIVKMSDTDYNAVIVGLSNAISKAPENGIFYYIRASIAEAHYHYLTAIEDYKAILDRGLYNYYGINASLAKCYYALCDFRKALDEVNYAIGATPDNGPYYITLSEIRLAMGDNSLALQAAEDALAKLPDNNNALSQQALALLANDRKEEASTLFGELIINLPESPDNYILRAYTLQQMGKRADAVNILNRCLAIEYPATDIRSLCGFALRLLDRDTEARAWIDAIMAERPTDVDGRLHYTAACLYAHLGDTDRALECLAVAFDKGFANLVDIEHNNNANLNLAPLRDNPEFRKIIKGYDYLFK